MAERNVTVRLRAVIDSYRKAMQDASKETSRFAAGAKGQFNQVGADMKKLGDDMTRKVTVPLTATGTIATKLGMDFETAFAQMVGLANVPASEIEGLRSSVLKLSRDTARAPQELAEALYYIRSSGVSAASSLDVLKVAAKASAAGLGQTQDIAKAVGFALNAYGEQNLSASRATDVLVAAVREGTLEAGDLAPVMGRLIPTAAALGISFDQVAGTLAVMSRTGLDAEEATTSLSAVFSTLLGTSKAGQALLDEKGLSLKKLRDIAAGPGGVVAAMRLLGTAFEGDDEALSTIIPNVRAFRAFMNVLAQDAGQVDDVLRNVADATGTADDAFQAVANTKAFKIRQDINEAKIALIQLGAALAPFVVVLGAIGGGIAATFGALPGLAKSAIAGFLLLLAAVGPVSKAAGTLIENFQTMFRVIQTGALNAVGHMQAIGVAVGIATIAVGAIAFAWAQSAQKAREAEARVRAYADAIREAGSVAKGASSQLAKMLASGDADALLRVMDKADVSVDALAEAAAAGGTQLDDMRLRLMSVFAATNAPSSTVVTDLKTIGVTADEAAQIMARGGERAKILTNQIGALSPATKTWFHDLLALKDTIGGTSTEVGKAATRAGQLDRVLGTTASTTDSTSSSMYGLGVSEEYAAAHAKALVDQLGVLFEASFAVMDAQQEWADALADVDAAAASSGGSTRDLEKDQRSLERATKDVAKAQQDLADAEAKLREARQGPTDREKKDASLDVREATLGLAEAERARADARKRLREERAKGKDGDVKGATLDLQSAQLRLERAQLRVKDAQAAQNEVLNSGADTSKKVRDAVDDVTAAQERLEDAQLRVADAEKQLNDPGGGPVADKHRAIRDAIDRTVTAGDNWIRKLIEQRKPTSEVVSAIDEQIGKLDELIGRYGDANGKLKERIDLLLVEKYLVGGINVDPYRGADEIFKAINRNLPGRATGGPVQAGRAYRVGENGIETFVPDVSGTIIPTGALTSAGSYPSPRSFVASVPLVVTVDGIGRIADGIIRLSHNTSGLDIKIVNS